MFGQIGLIMVSVCAIDMSLSNTLHLNLHSLQIQDFCWFMEHSYFTAFLDQQPFITTGYICGYIINCISISIGIYTLHLKEDSLTAQPLAVKGRVWFNLINSFVTLLEKQQSQSEYCIELCKACTHA